MGVLDRLEGTTLPTRTVTLCLDAGLRGQWDAVAARLEEAARKDTSLAMEHTVAVVEEMDEIRDKMAASEVTFEFESPDWTKRLALQAKHPPRDGDLLDQVRGYNVETFCPELIKACTVSVTDAEGDRATRIPAKTWKALFGSLNLGQFNELYAAASSTSDQSPQVPSSARFLLTNQDFGASSTQPGPGTSPPSGSAGGSRRGSRSTRTTKKAASVKR